MADLYMRFPQGLAKAFTMSYDDGVEQDCKLIELMDQNGLKGTFNLNSGLFAPEGTVYEEGRIHRRMTAKQAIKLYANTVHEVAVHGLTHPHLNLLPKAQMLYEIMEDRRRLEEMYGYTIRGMAYPFGSVDQSCSDVLKTAGIVYARTVQETEGFDLPKEWLYLNPTCHHTNPKLMELGDRFICQEEKEAQMFYLWGHSYEFEADHNWETITAFLKKIGNQSSIWYATNIEIYDYIHAYKQLHFGLSMQFVENPTATDLYFVWDHKDYCVKKGSRIALK